MLIIPTCWLHLQVRIKVGRRKYYPHYYHHLSSIRNILNNKYITKYLKCWLISFVHTFSVDIRAVRLIRTVLFLHFFPILLDWGWMEMKVWTVQHWCPSARPLHHQPPANIRHPAGLDTDLNGPTRCSQLPFWLF